MAKMIGKTTLCILSAASLWAASSAHAQDAEPPSHAPAASPQQAEPATKNAAAPADPAAAKSSKGTTLSEVVVKPKTVPVLPTHPCTDRDGGNPDAACLTQYLDYQRYKNPKAYKAALEAKCTQVFSDQIGMAMMSMASTGAGTTMGSQGAQFVSKPTDVLICSYYRQHPK